MPPRVSVIVPAYNYANYLGDCVRSLSEQSYQNWECIIVDDGSTDGTPDVCARLARDDARVRFLRQRNSGLSAARNAGIRVAIGEFLQFLDADDLLERDKLRAQVAWFDKIASCDIVVGNAAFFMDGVLEQLREWPVVPALQELPLSTLVEGNACVVNAALVRRRVIASVGYFDETLVAHEDWDFWLRCAISGAHFCVCSSGNDRALVRQHGCNMSSSRERMLRTAMLVRQRLGARLPEELQRENNERLSQMQRIYGMELLRSGRKREGWALYRAGLTLARNKPRALVRLLSLVPGASQLARFARRCLG